MRHRNGSRYNGYWSQGKRHGYGESQIYIYQKEASNAIRHNIFQYHNLESATKPSRNSKSNNIIRLEKYAGDWRMGVKDGFGTLEIERFGPTERNEFWHFNPPKTAVVETLYYEGCWRNGMYDGWVGNKTIILISQLFVIVRILTDRCEIRRIHIELYLLGTPN